MTESFIIHSLYLFGRGFLFGAIGATLVGGGVWFGMWLYFGFRDGF